MPLVSEILLGLYLGLLTGIFPAFIAFAIGFGFKYFTDITVPGLGVVVLGGALAGVSGGLMGLVEPQMTESWTGITAVLVILMVSLWAHGQGDKLGAATPRKLTLKYLRESRVSANLTDLVDSYGQLRIQPVGEIQDIEGYPPLTEELRQEIKQGTWRLPAKLSLAELETRLEEELVKDHDLAEANVTIDKKGRAQIQAAPSQAGLSKRIPPGTRAVSIKTLLPAGIARGDTATIQLPSGDATGPVVSARSEQPPAAQATTPTETDTPQEESAAPQAPTRRAATTRGGDGRITVAVPLDDAKRMLQADRAPMIVHARGEQREYEAVGLLKEHGNRFRRVQIEEASSLTDRTIGEANVRSTYDVLILAIRRGSERLLAPPASTRLDAGDTLIVAGAPGALDAFEEAVR